MNESTPRTQPQGPTQEELRPTFAEIRARFPDASRLGISAFTDESQEDVASACIFASPLRPFGCGVIVPFRKEAAL